MRERLPGTETFDGTTYDSSYFVLVRYRVEAQEMASTNCSSCHLRDRDRPDDQK